MSEPTEVHIHVHVGPATVDPQITTQITEIHSMVTALTEGATAMASDLSQLTAAVEANGSVAQSAITLLDGLKAALDEAGTDPAQLQQLSASLDSQRQALADALVRNTPSAGEATPA